jgi:hypothetical protein
MSLKIIDGWVHLSVLIVLAVILTRVMMKQGRQFFTMDPVKKQFSMLDLEFPGSAQEILNIVQGIYALPPADSQTVLRALRRQLRTDFLFMPVIYGAIFVLCKQVYWLMPKGEGDFFNFLAYLQAVPWLLDIIENIFLFGRIRKEATLCSRGTFAAYRVLELFKWGIALLGIAFGVSSLFYLWLTGHIA